MHLECTLLALSHTGVGISIGFTGFKKPKCLALNRSLVVHHLTHRVHVGMVTPWILTALQ